MYSKIDLWKVLKRVILILSPISLILGIILSCTAVFHLGSSAQSASSSGTNVSMTQTSNSPLSGTASTLPPTPTFTPTPQPTIQPSPTPTPCPTPCVLYQENGSDNWSGWLVSAPDWTVLNGKLINTDGNGNPLIVPYNPGANGYNDYAVEVKITRVKYTSDYGGSFGIVVRDPGNGGGYTLSICASLGYAFGVTWGCNHDSNTYRKAELLVGQSFPDGGTVLKQQPFTTTAGVEYTYRVEVKGGTIKVYINGNPILSSVTDFTYLSGGQVSIWDMGCQLSISSVEVIAPQRP